ncbi:MAG: DUF72 domain-containing protein [Thermoplasmata archaeon]
MVRVGTCGFPISRSVLFKTLDVVEVQRTFYRPPRIDTVRRWREEAPAGLRFTLKAWQLITHEPSSPTYRRLGMDIEGGRDRYGRFRPTRQVFEAWEVTEGICEALEASAVVFQSPPSFKESRENISNMMEFFSSLSPQWIFCWEPRGGWSPATILDLCSSLRLIHCVDPFAGPPLTKERAYLRLHGSPPGGKRYTYTYSDEDLRELRTMCEGYEEVYVLFNNVTMFADAVRFKEAMRV